MHLKSLVIILVLSCFGVAFSNASPSSSQLYRLAYYKAPSKVRKIEQVDDMISNEQLEIDNEDDDDDDDDFVNMQLSGSRQQSASSGRLFFKGLFGQQQAQPQIIPIVITGNNGNNGVTSTGSIPQATGTLQTTPISRGYADGERDVIQAGPEAYEEEEEKEAQASLVAGAKEYVVTDQAIKGTAGDGSNIVHKLPSNINLRRPGKADSVVSLNIPSGYKKYFKNGQKVLLTAPNKRRRRRRNNNRNNRRRKNRN